jgi:hypothetical protein
MRKQQDTNLHLLSTALMLFCCAREGGGGASSKTEIMVATYD